jgi:hypothetical protein
LNDLWKYGKEKVISYEELNIKFSARNSIHILGEIIGSNIEAKSNEIVVEGSMETI